jgi:hypothetical protein
VLRNQPYFPDSVASLNQTSQLGINKANPTPLDALLIRNGRSKNLKQTHPVSTSIDSMLSLGFLRKLYTLFGNPKQYFFTSPGNRALQ